MRFYFLLLITLLGFPAFAQETWELVKSDANVTVFTKQLPGQPYKSFKAVGIVQSTPEKLLEILDDVTRYEQWFAYSKSVRLLKTEAFRKYVYMETNFPWPFSNEDMVYVLSIGKNKNGEIKLLLNGNPDYIPTIDGVKRMRAANGYILLQSDLNKESNEGQEQTIITYVMHTELSGDIPPWLANKNIHMLPYKTLKSFINIAKDI